MTLVGYMHGEPTLKRDDQLIFYHQRIHCLTPHVWH